MPKMMEFCEWSDKWKRLRGECDNINGVLGMWRAAVPRECLRRNWELPSGYRNNHKNGRGRGEQIVEGLFLGEKGGPLKCHSLFSQLQPKHLIIEAVGHKMPLATRSKGQVIADCLGIVSWKGVRHPLAIEVKTNANDCWYAVVENLLQVKMLRANVCNVKKLFESRDRKNVKGAWGMVLAPEKYFCKSNKLEEAKTLLKALSDASNARIMLVSAAELDKQMLVHIDGYWPK